MNLLQMGLLAFALTLTGCASIVSKSDWPVAFKSNPPGAEIVITDETGNEINRGTTPATFTLKSSSGFFSGATYYVEYKEKDYQICKRSLNSKVNGWYFGNIVFGGLIGMLIVDPATGAMFKLPKLNTVNLTRLDSQSVQPQTVAGVSTNSMPAEINTNSVQLK